MKFSPATVAAWLVLGAASMPALAVRARRGPTSQHTVHHSSHATRSHAAANPARPRQIDDDRATQIQQALIKAGYMQGEPTGHWDSTSEAAMQKLQSDNGWQTKLVPDSRALIKLGLGGSAPAPATSTASQPAATTPVTQ